MSRRVPEARSPDAEPQEGSRCVCSPGAEFIFLWKEPFSGTVARDNWDYEERMLRLGTPCFSDVLKLAPGSRANLAVNFSVYRFPNFGLERFWVLSGPTVCPSTVSVDK